jgi:SAM-dependent methyltransferase
MNYYDQHAESFKERTLHVDMGSLYQAFEPLLQKSAKILDAGCGSGRDARYFKSRGYHVVAMDGSYAMVKIASEVLEEPCLHLSFQEMAFRKEFDAIWANASLLHVPYEELKEVCLNLHQALKHSGVLYASFKYGTGKRETDGRTFYDMNEEMILPYLRGCFDVINIWKTADTRSQVAPSPENAWLNILARSI